MRSGVPLRLVNVDVLVVAGNRRLVMMAFGFGAEPRTPPPNDVDFPRQRQLVSAASTSLSRLGCCRSRRHLHTPDGRPFSGR
jgi:hypothetical protein